MCGIIGHIGERETDKVVYEGLKRLDYRGYDSWGVATEKGTVKDVGKLDEKLIRLSSYTQDAKTSIGHTRWATHGGVTQENAHPHESCEERFAVVHNGIIENHEEIKEWLETKGSHEYTSETDTEIIAHYIEDRVSDLMDEYDPEEPRVVKALRKFHERAEGSYALAVLDREEEQLYALRNKSPLVFATEERKEVPPGIKDVYFASDIYALSSYVDEAHFMEDGEVIMTNGSNAAIFRDGETVEPEFEDFQWTEESPELGDHDHWMEKEILEIPHALRRAEKKYNHDSTELEKFCQELEESDRIIFTASGTSYHAALLGVYYLQKAGIEAQALIASEFQNYERVTENTTVVAVSQSGETRDVLDAISYSREKGASIASITNVPHSTLERESDTNLRIEAHQEICVAATKTFTNQLGVLMAIASNLGAELHSDSLGAKSRALACKENMSRTKMAAIEDAGKLKNEEDIYVLGSGVTYPVSREIALKLKEISYIHAEGMMAGELKHGTLALVEEGTPVIALNDGSLDSSIEEVESRGADVIEIDIEDFQSEEEFLFASNIYGFWLTYYLGKFNDLPIDKPRNLAKSVTVK